MIGLPEKDDENDWEAVIGILTRIIPMSVETLRDTVDTVHRLGKRESAATSNDVSRFVIIQFGKACCGMKSGENPKMLESVKIFTSASRKISPRRTD